MDSSKLTPATSGFVLAAGITVLFNTALSCAKDAYAPLKAVMKSVAGRDWTTQGLIDLALFAGLGFVFMIARVGERIPSEPADRRPGWGGSDRGVSSLLYGLPSFNTAHNFSFRIASTASFRRDHHLGTPRRTDQRYVRGRIAQSRRRGAGTPGYRRS